VIGNDTYPTAMQQRPDETLPNRKDGGSSDTIPETLDDPDILTQTRPGTNQKKNSSNIFPETHTQAKTCMAN
jgi:hypothetical protein